MKYNYSTKIIDPNLYETINININENINITGLTNGQGYVYVPYIFVEKTPYINNIIWQDDIEILRIERKTKLDRLNEIMYNIK